MSGRRVASAPVVRIPAGPRCTVCGHPACPCCATNGAGWCDVVTEAVELCCDGQCTYADPDALRAWEKRIAPQLDRAFKTGRAITVIDDEAASSE
jgi:hypothetical protein